MQNYSKLECGKHNKIVKKIIANYCKVYEFKSNLALQKIEELVATAKISPAACIFFIATS